MFQALFGFITRQRTMETAELNIVSTSWFCDRLKWCPTSLKALEEAEKKVLSYLKKPFTLKYIEIASNKGEKDWRIRTIVMNEDNADKKTPLLMLHGLGSAIGLWVLNLDTLSKERPLFAIDVLGFGLSSRPSFGNDALKTEEMLVESVESWREKVGLDKFVLLGHSMGGFLATAYAMRYPQHIHHLILADPWGYPERDTTVRKIQIPFWARVVANILQFFNPLVMLRAAGPWGPRLVERTRPDILHKFDALMDDHNDMANYIYHCNAQTPSGESAFKSMSSGFGWAKHPMIPRIAELHEDIPISFLYGARSWMDHHSGNVIKQLRPASKVKVLLIEDSGHHVNADHPDLFNSVIQEICEQVDELAYKTKAFNVPQLSCADEKKEYTFYNPDIKHIPGRSSVP